MARESTTATTEMSRRDPLANPEPLIRRVYAYVAYRVGDRTDAEDITSETFERALRYRDRYDERKGDADRVAPRDRAKLHQRYELAVRISRVRACPSADPADLEEAAVRRVTLAAALAQLDPHDQDLIALRYGADLTARRIGEILGMSTNAAEVALHRALGRLPGPSRRGGGADQYIHPATDRGL